MSTRQELIDAAHANWNANQGVEPEVLRDLGYDTPDTLPTTIERVLGEKAAIPAARLELVDERHEPQPGARFEPRLRERPRPRTAADKAARDMDESTRRKTALGHDPYPPLRKAS